MAIVTNLGIAGMHWIIEKHAIFLSQFLQQKKLKKYVKVCKVSFHWINFENCHASGKILPHNLEPE